MDSRLSRAQVDALVALAAVEPRFALTGGAALAGFYLGHRTTRDLDLFFHESHSLGLVPDRALASLRASGFESAVEERFETFCRIVARRDDELVVIDLVADPVPTIEPATEHRIGTARVAVDTLREITANKLCSLVGRSELRDLIDLVAILATGVDLDTALGDAAAKDGGFSPIVFGWALRRFPLEKIARSEGLDDRAIAHLETARNALIERVATLTAPT